MSKKLITLTAMMAFAGINKEVYNPKFTTNQSCTPKEFGMSYKSRRSRYGKKW
jgi:hypothetical protein